MRSARAAGAGGEQAGEVVAAHGAGDLADAVEVAIDRGLLVGKTSMRFSRNFCGVSGNSMWRPPGKSNSS
jgi:hypothetical protein